jgi:hypothetical protein
MATSQRSEWMMNRRPPAKRPHFFSPGQNLRQARPVSLKPFLRRAHFFGKELAMHEIRPVVCTSWGTEVSRFGVHVA